MHARNKFSNSAMSRRCLGTKALSRHAMNEVPRAGLAQQISARLTRKEKSFREASKRQLCQQYWILDIHCLHYNLQLQRQLWQQYWILDIHCLHYTTTTTRALTILDIHCLHYNYNESFDNIGYSLHSQHYNILFLGCICVFCCRCCVPVDCWWRYPCLWTSHLHW